MTSYCLTCQNNLICFTYRVQGRTWHTFGCLECGRTLGRFGGLNLNMPEECEYTTTRFSVGDISIWDHFCETVIEDVRNYSVACGVDYDSDINVKRRLRRSRNFASKYFCAECALVKSKELEVRMSRERELCLTLPA